MMDAFEKFLVSAISFAVDLYIVVGGLVLLFILYGVLWLIVSIVWSKIHKKSHDYVVESFKKAIGWKKEEVEE
jgi:hypothetical protein